MNTFLLAAFLLASSAHAQSPLFEAASIKLNPSGAPGGSKRILPGGRFEATNTTLQAMIREAYDVRDFQITGGPEWLDTDRFDIVAKAKGDVPFRQMRPMLQALLVERFKLTLHRETKELPVYTLGVGKNGAKFHKATADDQHTMAAGPGEISDHGVAIPIFIRQLSGLVDRAVVDQTGLKGSYDLNLKWMPEQDTGPSLFTALQEQLGLKLSGGKGPVDVLVIDRVDRVPVEN